jgi:hypothetical protein
MNPKNLFRADPFPYIFKLLARNPREIERLIRDWASFSLDLGRSTSEVREAIIGFHRDLLRELLEEGDLLEHESEPITATVQRALESEIASYVPRKKPPGREEVRAKQAELRDQQYLYVTCTNRRKMMTIARRLRRTGREMDLAWGEIFFIELVLGNNPGEYMAHRRRGGSDADFVREQLARSDARNVETESPEEAYTDLPPEYLENLPYDVRTQNRSAIRRAISRFNLAEADVHGLIRLGGGEGQADGPLLSAARDMRDEAGKELADVIASLSEVPGRFKGIERRGVIYIDVSKLPGSGDIKVLMLHRDLWDFSYEDSGSGGADL